MKLDTRYFGEIEFDENVIIHLQNGLIGLEYLKSFILIQSEDENSPFAYLQCLNDEDFCFLVVDPTEYLKDYQPNLKNQLKNTLGEDVKEEDLSYLCILNGQGEFSNITINLMAPIVIHLTTFEGVQLISESNDYEIKQNFKDLVEKSMQ